MSPKHLKGICYWSHQFAGGKNINTKTLQVDLKVNFEPRLCLQISVMLHVRLQIEGFNL